MQTENLGIEKIKRKSVSEEVITQILGLIEKNVYKPGDLLPTERDLAEMFGVGRSSVREALRVLQSMEVVEKKAGSGTYLTNRTLASTRIFNTSYILEKFEIIDLSEARLVLEEQIVGLAAKRAGRENIEAMREANLQLEKLIGCGDRQKIVESDFNVHRMIADGAQNVFLSDMLEALGVALVKYNIAVLTQDKTESAVEFHNRIIDAVEAKDEQGARKEMENHIKNVHERIAAEYYANRR